MSCFRSILRRNSLLYRMFSFDVFICIYRNIRKRLFSQVGTSDKKTLVFSALRLKSEHVFLNESDVCHLIWNSGRWLLNEVINSMYGVETSLQYGKLSLRL